MFFHFLTCLTGASHIETDAAIRFILDFVLISSRAHWNPGLNIDYGIIMDVNAVLSAIMLPPYYKKEVRYSLSHIALRQT